jgi:hypothetical protein
MPDNLTAPVHKFLSEGMSVDQVIAELKRIGFDRTRTVQALQRAMSMEKEKAEDRVRNHPAWSTSGSPSAGG